MSFDGNNEEEAFDPDVSVICKELSSLIACQNATFKGFGFAKKCIVL